jgi:transcriptional regulator with XRE-family HTH domain
VNPVPRPLVDPRFAETLRRLRAERGLSLRDLARRAVHGKSYLHEIETGAKPPTVDLARRLDIALDARGELAALVQPGVVAVFADGEMDALELARRVAATDVSDETLTRLEEAADDLAMAYATTPPEELLPRVRRHVAYVGRLIDARKTLDQHRRLLVVGGWLSLLGATVLIDLRQRPAASSYLATARQMADHAEHAEIGAWVAETRAWDALTEGDFRRALELAQQAQALAPRHSSAYIQATAQEGRAWSRMHQPAETRQVLHKVARLVSPLSVPEHPEHHYRYDPGKALSYTATTLAWVGDPAAEEYARDVIRQLEMASDRVPRPRRVASARLDLGLALLGAGKPDEAGAEALAAVTSGRVVGSNWWRATEILAGVEEAGIGEAVELREAFEAFRPVAVPQR